MSRCGSCIVLSSHDLETVKGTQFTAPKTNWFFLYVLVKFPLNPSGVGFAPLRSMPHTLVSPLFIDKNQHVIHNYIILHMHGAWPSRPRQVICRLILTTHEKNTYWSLQ